MVSTNGCLANGHLANGSLANGNLANGNLANGTTGDKKRKFTWQELATYNRRDNAHVAVHGKVYDVSSFIDKHPGGADQIALGAGRDISQVFESYHSKNAFQILEKFYVGDLVTREFPIYPPRGEFYRTVRQRVDKYFKENNIDPKNDPWMIFWYIFYLGFAFLCTLFVLQNHENVLLSMFVSALWGFDCALGAMSILHDAAHFCITHKPWVWRAFGIAQDLFLGGSIYVWIHQHTMGHHQYTNIDGSDPDIYTHQEIPDFRRIKHRQPWIFFNMYQHVYLPLVYCFLSWQLRIQDIVFMIAGRTTGLRLTIPTYSQVAQFYFSKIFYVSYRYALLYFYMPLWKVLLYNMIIEFVTSYWVALVSQSSHVSSEVEWPQPDADNKMNQDWAELQVATTQDYATDSWLWSMITGSLNHQSVHHVIPGVIQSHHRLITPILRETCKEFGIKYNNVNTFWEALGFHINHLKRLGQGDDKDKQA